MVERVVQRILPVLMARLGQQMDDHLGVSGGLKDVPHLLVVPSEQGGIDQVSIVRDGDLPTGISEQQWLGVPFGG